MMTASIVALVNAVRRNDAQTATSIAALFSIAERETAAEFLSETATFLRRYNKAVRDEEDETP